MTEGAAWKGGSSQNQLSLDARRSPLADSMKRREMHQSTRDVVES